MSNYQKTTRRGTIRRRIRKKIAGTAEKPRLSVYKSSKHVYAQLINDEAGITMAAASSRSKNLKDALEGKSRMEMAELVGESLAKTAVENGVSKVVFDRSGYKYHGIVKQLAEGARKGGLQF